MDTYTKHLYEDFIRLLTERIQNITRITNNKLDQIEKKLGADEKQLDMSRQSLDLNISISSEISKLKTYLLQDDHRSMGDLIDSTASAIIDNIKETLKSISSTINSNHPEIKEFISLQNKKIETQVVDNFIKKLDANRDELLNAILANLSSETQKTVATYNSLLDIVQALNTMVSDHHIEVLQKLNDLKDSLESRYLEQSSNNEKFMEDINTNQELLVWILTPWYKKIFRRKDEKPRILVKKPTTKPGSY